jgi:predicted DNA-binding protein with PD1-like motif
MQYQEGSIGRVFALRLEEGDRLPDTLEAFAREQRLAAAMVIYVGGAKEGSRLVVGPDASRTDAIVPLVHSLTGIQEVLAVGTLFPDDQGEPVLHMHAATGREGDATVGCSRAGVEVWLVGEVIILEILGTSGRRRPELPSGFSLLQFGE